MITIAIALLLIAFPISAAFPAAEGERLSWDFSSPGQAAGWTGEGIQSSGIRDGRLQILGGEQAQILFPPGLSFHPEKNRYLKIRFKTSSPRYLQILWESRVVPGEIARLTLPPSLDGNLHSRWIDLSESRRWSGEILRMAMVFSGQPGWIEIDSIEVGPFDFGQYLSGQWREFWLPRAMNLALINSLPSPYIFNKPLATWLNLLAVGVLLAGAYFYFKANDKRNNAIISRTGLALLVIWLVYDLRETYSQYKMADEIYQSYVKPPPEGKTFPPLGDFYRFVDFCRKHIPEQALFQLLPIPYWPFDCRMKYFLYPRWEKNEKVKSYPAGRWPMYYIVYNAPQIVFDQATGQLRARNGQTVFAQKCRIVAQYSQDSFICLERKD